MCPCRYYIAANRYPMNELPPFVEGPCIVVSADLVEVLDTHRHLFKAFTHLDDPTLALWFLAMQIHPTPLNEFMSGSLYSAQCHQKLVMIPNLYANDLRALWAAHMGRKNLCKAYYKLQRHNNGRKIVKPAA